MNPGRLLSATAVVATAAVASSAAAAFSSQTQTASRPPLRPTARGVAALHYRNYHASYYESVDVDGDRMSLLSLLDPPSPPLHVTQVAPSNATSDSPVMAATAKTSTLTTAMVAPRSSSRNGSGRAARRPSPVTELRSVQDYHRHVLNEPGAMCVVRFSAPWCRVCQSTNVAWERMASRLQKASKGGGIKFLSVSLDGRDESITALRDMLQITRVPQGIVHHPAGGVFGKRVDLGRSDLSLLRKRLEGYLGEGDGDGATVVEGLRG